MIAAPLPHNESSRLAALQALLVMDTPPDQRLDQIVRFAASEYDVPIALITLLDADRQWFKASIGIPASLAALKITRDQIPALVAVAEQDICRNTNPRPRIRRN